MTKRIDRGALSKGVAKVASRHTGRALVHTALRPSSISAGAKFAGEALESVPNPLVKSVGAGLVAVAGHPKALSTGAHVVGAGMHAVFSKKKSGA